MPKISTLEQNDNWQATAEDANKHQIAIARCQPGGPSEGRFSLYDGNWTATAYPPGSEGMKTYSLQEVQEMFAGGALKLIKGTIPE